jgi:6-phosphogluconate dehydrogenase
MQVIIIAGVSGAGKSTIGKHLAALLDLPFKDADDYHSSENIEKMMQGIALQDEDREAWLHLLAQKIEDWHLEEGAVLACSALKERYREILGSKIPAKDLVWIFLHADHEIIAERLKGREDHFFKATLLRSQYEELETAEYGIHINVNTSKNEILKKIMRNLSSKEQKSEIGIIGLGVMGQSLALNMASKEINVAVYNRHVPGVEEDIAENFADSHIQNYSFPWFHEVRPFLDALERPRTILLMVSAGKAVDAVLEGLLPYLEPDDLIIDGGNSHYKDTVRRQEFLQSKKVLFMGMGISGGEEGARNGPSIMPGGAKQAYKRVEPILKQIAAKDMNGDACCTYLGEGGAGHFVKMVHNGIEYGEMQLIAETYQFLRLSYDMAPEEIAQLFETWNKELRSYLLEISIDILRKKEEGGLLLDKVLDAAKQKGTGGWSTEAALELGVALDTITAAVMARNISGRKEEREQAHDLFAEMENPGPEARDLQEVFEAFSCAMIVNHAIGFDLLAKASDAYEYGLNLSEVARIWTNGCIIRSAFMERLIPLFDQKSYRHLLLHPEISAELKKKSKALAKITSEALGTGVPVPLMSAAINYFLSLKSNPSSANLIQAQRDYFGAHTYERVDHPRGAFFHSDWKDPSGNKEK